MTDLMREPGRWRGDPPDGELVMQVVGPPLASARPGWPTVTGWREIANEPARVWVQVQVEIDPDDREPETVASSYQPDDPVWVWQRGHWCRGRVAQAAGQAVLARYLTPEVSGWQIDEFRPKYVMARDGGNWSPAPRSAARPRPVMQHLIGTHINLDREATAAVEADEQVPITVATVLAGPEPDYVELYGLIRGLAGNTEWAHYKVRASRLPPPTDVGPG